MNLIDKVKNRPIDKTAALVVSKGEDYQPEFKVPEGKQEWDDFPADLVRQPPKSIENLIGRRREGVEIVAYLGAIKKSNGWKHKWLAKCSCGKFILRDGITWRKSVKRGFIDFGCHTCYKKELRRRYGTDEIPAFEERLGIQEDKNP